jgi:hypothetical protein
VEVWGVVGFAEVDADFDFEVDLVGVLDNSESLMLVLALVGALSFARTLL